MIMSTVRKPHIYKFYGAWVCRHGALKARGDTPAAAWSLYAALYLY